MRGRLRPGRLTSHSPFGGIAPGSYQWGFHRCDGYCPCWLPWRPQPCSRPAAAAQRAAGAARGAHHPPWFEGNDPSNGKGYESAVAYAIARQLGFTNSQVHWAYEPFNASYSPGPKKFDFDINEISYTPQRATAVTFSDSYYDVQQALVALKNTPIATSHTPADLKSDIFGDQVGTTSLAYINSEIQPTTRPKVFQTLNDVKEALQTHQIAALVTDTPTAQYISSSEIKGSVMVGQFPSTGEHYGLLFSLGNPLVTCVNKAITTLKSNGTLAALQKKYLKIYLSVPVIKP